jgi:hypothetical protein
MIVNIINYLPQPLGFSTHYYENPYFFRILPQVVLNSLRTLNLQVYTNWGAAALKVNKFVRGQATRWVKAPRG